MSIVGIIGKIGHGKDTVADFIRRNAETVYTVRRFADPLKACVAEILNCSVFDLEDRNFKEKPLGEEYETYVTNDPFLEEHFSAMNRSEFEDFVEINGGDEVVIMERYSIQLITNTPRKMLQTLGTEWGRNMIHPDIWVNSMMSLYEQSRVNGSNGNYPDWLMPDVRFPNEAKAIKDRGGILIKVIRPGVDTGSHISEVAVDKIQADHTIINDSTLVVLENKTQSLIKELGL